MTFAPCFLWIFLGAPYIEALRGNRALSTALSGITAAVVGVVLNLAVSFALQALFSTVKTHHRRGMTLHVPVWRTFQPASMVIATGAMMALMRFKIE